MNYEYSLVLFTVLAQMAVGISIANAVLSHSLLAIQVEQKSWIFACVALVLAFAASLFHLLSPLNAPYTITQLGHSWLSREILFGGFFAFILFLRTCKILSAKYNYLVAFVGILFVCVISQVYMQNTITPFWNSFATPLIFFATSLLLGSSASLVLRAKFLTENNFFLLASLFLVGALASLLFPAFCLQSSQLVRDPLFASFAKASVCVSLTQLACFSLGGIALAHTVRKKCFCQWFAFLLVFIGAFVGRMLFYAGHFTLGF